MLAPQTQFESTDPKAPKWQPFRSLVRELEEDHDLEGLAIIAETGLSALRKLCERPEICVRLGEMMETVRSLRRDELERDTDS